jgi:hypothetical protein
VRYRAVHISRDPRFALERDAVTGEPVFSIPVANSRAEYEEYYSLSEEELKTLLADIELAKDFAFRCGRRELDDRLILKPGPERGHYSG